MKKIPSFTIDHNRLVRGIYVSRQDNVGDDMVTTFDTLGVRPKKLWNFHICLKSKRTLITNF